MKISSPFYSFYAIFFALAMLNAPPLEKDINCYRYKAEAYIVIETFIPEQVEDTVTHHPAGFKCFKDSLTCEKSLTFPDPQRKWNLFFRERPKNSSQFLRAAFPRKSKRNPLQHKQNKTHRAGIWCSAYGLLRKKTIPVAHYCVHEGKKPALQRTEVFEWITVKVNNPLKRPKYVKKAQKERAETHLCSFFWPYLDRII